MTYLVDTNIWLEVLLAQEREDEAHDFFTRLPGSQLAITDFSLFSIGIVLTRLGKDEVFRALLTDIEMTGVHLLGLALSELVRVLEVRGRFTLDFDDAYQFAVAEMHERTIVTFDQDFDKTERAIRPGQARAEWPE